MKNLPKYLPILSVALVFAGYCHLHFYYCTQFNIDIYQFISTGEIILSFLPIAYYLFLFIIIFGFITILYITSPDDKRKNDGNNEVWLVYPLIKYEDAPSKGYSWSVYNKFFILKKNKLTRKQRWFLRYKLVFHFQTIGWSLWILLTFYGLNHDWKEDALLFGFFGIIWIILLFVVIRRRFNIAVANLFKQSYKQVYFGCLVVITFIFVDYGGNKSKANDVKNRIDSQAVSFNYEGVKFDTFNDTLLSYIGSTQQYIFIFNLQDHNNLIFEKSKVSSLVIGNKPEKQLITIDTNLVNKILPIVCDSIKKFDSLKVADTTVLFKLRVLCDSFVKNNSTKLDSIHIKKKK